MTKIFTFFHYFQEGKIVNPDNVAAAEAVRSLQSSPETADSMEVNFDDEDCLSGRIFAWGRLSTCCMVEVSICFNLGWVDSSASVKSISICDGVRSFE